MSIAVTLNRTIRLDGKSFAENRTLSSNAAIKRDVALAAAKVGSLTTRTDNTTGTLTMNAGHGFTTGAKIDLYWAGGCRRNVTVGTVATNSVPISGGSGDNLPVATTAITAMIPTNVEMRFDGDDVVVICVSAAVPCIASFQSSAPAELLGVDLPYGGQVYTWTNQDGITNPLAGVTVVTVNVSHGDSSGAKTVSIGAAIN